MKKTFAITVFVAIVSLTGYWYYPSSTSQFDTLEDIKLQIRSTFPNVKQISTTDFKQLSEQLEEKEFVLLDVREPKEYQVSHIKNAKLSTDIDDALFILRKTPKDSLIIAYCSVGYRSSALAKTLSAQGYTNVLNLEGSIFEWANQGNPVYRQGETVHRVHPYNATWGKFLNEAYHPNSD